MGRELGGEDFEFPVYVEPWISKVGVCNDLYASGSRAMVKDVRLMI